MRTIGALIILSLAVASCSTLKTSGTKKAPPKSAETHNNKIEILPSSPRNEERIAAPTAVEAESGNEASESSGPLKNFAVFIDAAGSDAFAAIGFLQEMERNGMRPVKVMGVGFGCYAALAWASDNNGNKAEWEALKFDSWGAISKGSMVGRIVSRNSKEKFRADFQKAFSKRSFSELKVPADCPVVSKNYPFALRGGAISDLAELLWTQLQIPSLVREESITSGSYLSGALAGNISEREWTDLAKPQSASPDFGGFIYIKTRTTFDAIGDDNWSYTIFGRLDRESREKAQRRIGNLKIYTVDLAVGQSRNTESLTDPAERRKSLLEGRRKAAPQIPRLQSWLRGV